MNRWQPSRKYDHVFAIVRCDTYRAVAEPQTAIVITKVVWDEEVAQAEVDRLNELNQEKNCVYFWQITRLERQPKSET